jgi:flavin reductase (DIM6/NTAB) family NADH-FMN oxidoreductase RutF
MAVSLSWEVPLMKLDIPIRAPAQVDFPDYVGWLHSNILIPYPLYIITTVDEAGIPNAQPNTWGLPFGDTYGQFFVFYDWASHHTVQNIITTKEFVVNVPCEDKVSQVMKTVAHYPRGLDEVEASGLTAIPSRMVKAPRIEECKAHFECRVCWWRETHGRGQDDRGVLVLGEIVAASGDEDILGGTSPEKIENMRTAYVLSRNVDGLNMEVTNSMTYGTIDRLKDFLKLEKDATIEYV